MFKTRFFDATSTIFPEGERFFIGAVAQFLTEDSSHEVSEAEVLGWWSVVHGLAFFAIDGHLGKTASRPARTAELVLSVLDALDSRAMASSAVKQVKSR